MALPSQNYSQHVKILLMMHFLYKTLFKPEVFPERLRWEIFLSCHMFTDSFYKSIFFAGPHDDKVLGYIPLPSFKIRPVGTEDRVFRRFAFKAEHENTRTYYFVAETKLQMTQWMNALSLASIMQKDTGYVFVLILVYALVVLCLCWDMCLFYVLHRWQRLYRHYCEKFYINGECFML